MAVQTTEPEWARCAENIVREIAFSSKHSVFSSDDVWDLLTQDEVPPPHEPRALGPIMQRLAREKVMVPVGYAESRRRHGGIVRTYISAKV